MTNEPTSDPSGRGPGVNTDYGPRTAGQRLQAVCILLMLLIPLAAAIVDAVRVFVLEVAP